MAHRVRAFDVGALPTRQPVDLPEGALDDVRPTTPVEVRRGVAVHTEKRHLALRRHAEVPALGGSVGIFECLHSSANVVVTERSGERPHGRREVVGKRRQGVVDRGVESVGRSPRIPLRLVNDRQRLLELFKLERGVHVLVDGERDRVLSGHVVGDVVTGVALRFRAGHARVRDRHLAPPDGGADAGRILVTSRDASRETKVGFAEFDHIFRGDCRVVHRPGGGSN